MPRLQPKEIWKVALSDAEGLEQAGDRPAIVISIHPQANVTMVVPLTKNQDYLRFPYSHQVKKSNTNGLIGFCCYSLSNALSYSFFHKLLG
jgi:mRNA-degrading endonuclease toxin of MazEF toxin-antitoxin module